MLAQVIELPADQAEAEKAEKAAAAAAKLAAIRAAEQNVIVYETETNVDSTEIRTSSANIKLES